MMLLFRKNEHYDNVISFKITTKDDKLEDILL